MTNISSSFKVRGEETQRHTEFRWSEGSSLFYGESPKAFLPHTFPSNATSQCGKDWLSLAGFLTGDVENSELDDIR